MFAEFTKSFWGPCSTKLRRTTGLLVASLTITTSKPTSSRVLRAASPMGTLICNLLQSAWDAFQIMPWDYISPSVDYQHTLSIFEWTATKCICKQILCVFIMHSPQIKADTFCPNLFLFSGNPNKATYGSPKSFWWNKMSCFKRMREVCVDNQIHHYWNWRLDIGVGRIEWCWLENLPPELSKDVEGGMYDLVYTGR